MMTKEWFIKIINFINPGDKIAYARAWSYKFIQ